MTTKMNLEGTNRKALVAVIAEITGEKPIYRNMPTCNYDIGEITVLLKKALHPKRQRNWKRNPQG